MTLLKQAALPPLSKEEERRLFRIFQEGSEERKRETVDIIVRSNLKLVFKIANEFLKSSMEFDDLVEEGCLGLIKAVSKFDLSKDIRFITYAAWHIRDKMRQAVRGKGTLIPVPYSTLKPKAVLLKQRQEFKSRFRREPSLNELAEFSGRSVSDVRRLLYVPRQSVSIDEEIETKEGEKVPRRIICSDNVVTSLRRRELNDSLHLLLRRNLDKRDQRILILHFGLDGSQPRTLEEIAQDVGRCRERVRKMFNLALEKLKTAWRKQEEKERRCKRKPNRKSNKGSKNMPLSI